MNWVTIILFLEDAAWVTLAAIHLLVWMKSPRDWGHLFFSFSAVAAAAIAVCEFLLLRTESVEQYGRVMWWSHVPLWVLLVCIAWFTRFHLNAGRPWLAWVVTAMRTLTLGLNCFSTPYISF